MKNTYGLSTASVAGSGADVSPEGSARGNQHGLLFMRTVSAAVEALHAVPQPVVARVAGVCVGAGLNMALFYLTTGRRVKALGPDDEPPLAARVFAGVSLTAWLGVIMAGRVITAFRPPAWFWCAWCG